MEPILQRFGDVTIERLEKPKAPKPQPEAQPEKSQSKNVQEDRSIEDTLSLKRSFPDSQISIKRFKVDPEPSGNQELPPTRKPPISFSENTQKFIRDNLGGDETESDLSDFDSDSEIDSENDFPLATNNKSIIPGATITKPNLDNLEDDEDESSNTSFLEKFADDSFAEGETESAANKPQEKGEDTEDYDFDIKEKLKEMGEISFQTVKKGDKPKKVEVSTENEVVVTPARKTGSAADEEASAERKGTLNLRRNIREVMDETKLDESTLAAQRQEMERLQRVQEQQRLLREFQRQAAQERMQHKVISLLQGNNFGKPGTSSATTRIGNTVLVKLPNGQTKPMTKLPKKPFDLVKIHKSSGPIGPNFGKSAGLISVKRPGTNLTPSVSIAPVSKRVTAPIARIHREFHSDDSDSDEDVKPPLPLPKMHREPEATIDISSDDDCIVVSEPETEETDDDPGNSGMHTNDQFNQPDDQGRVVVNIGHPDNEPDIFLAPQIARIIKPHQIGGVRFLYDNVIESTGRFESSAGFGCILAHSMGLGKTLQVVSFSDIFLRHTPAKTILCIMPINTLQNWLAEYNMWLPTEEGAPNSPLTGTGDIRSRTFNLHVLNDSHKTLAARAKVIHAWKTGGGVLLIGYEQFRLLSLRKHPKSRRKAAAILERPDDAKNKALFDDVHEALVTPGPDLVICDEGHRIKNSHASISQALKQMRTKRRVVLTGYPLQNNLMEYWCMVDFVRPNYLGSKTEFCNMFERPIMNGQCIDSTETDIKLMRYRAHVLHSLLVGFVQRRSHAVLQTALPQKEEYVLLVRMLPFQRKLYETFMDEVVRSQAVPNPLKAFAVCCKIWNHPDVLYNFLKKRARGDAVDIDLEEVGGAPAEQSKTTKKAPARAKRGAAKGKKPAASITPYNSTSDTVNVTQQPMTAARSDSCYSGDSQQPFFDQSNAQFPNCVNFGNGNREKGPTNFMNSFPPEQGTSSNQNFINNISDNSQYPGSSTSNYNGGFDSHRGSFQNFQPQQNYWGQQQQQQQIPQGDFYNFGNQNYGNDQSNWIKTEEGSSPLKCENSNETKPKIKIISDIKLPMFGGGAASNNSQEKIKILSDIKLEPKQEEMENKFDIKQEIKNELISDMKSDVCKPDGLEDESTIGKVEPPLAKLSLKDLKEDSGIPYDWAIELLKDYVPGCIENSAKMEILFCIIRESIALGDRLLVFSQSLITLDLIEQFLHMNLVPGDTVKWARNTSYYRLDGSTSALEREKLINEFNSNPKIHVFLVSTRAGSLGINLIGANRVVVLDASWNPCHDTQAVCRVYRYGQRKPCFVYRLVVDNCLEKKIYDRQINKQGMSDRVVDECNPDAHLTMKDVSTLCWDDKTDEGEEKDWIHVKDNYRDVVLQKVIELHGRRFNKEPFQHESLLVDRKEKQLSSQEKRLAKKGYEREKQAARQPAYNVMGGGRGHRPIASVRPMQQGNERPSRWIPAEHWQRQGMTAQEMTLPLDVVIPTNQPEKGNIVLKAGQKVLVLKSPKGVYMQLESGKIVAIKTAIKVKGKAEDNNDPAKMLKQSLPPSTAMKVNHPSLNNVLPQKRMVKPFIPGVTKMNVRSVRQSVPNFVSRIQSVTRGGKSRQFSSPHLMDAKSPQSKEQHEMMPGGSSSDEEHNIDHLNQNHLDIVLPGRNNNMNAEIEKQISLLKKQVSVRRLPVPVQSNQEQKHASALQRLEQTTTSVLNDNRPFQETLDSITSSYKDDGLEEDGSSTQNPKNAQQAHCGDGSDQSDDVTYVSEQPPSQPYQQVQRQNLGVKSDQQQQGDYNNSFHGYYNYNNMQAYHGAGAQPHPAQSYAYVAPPPQTAPSYDMMGYHAQSQSQPPQYNYGYQGYQPHYAQPPPPPPPQSGYDFNGVPPVAPPQTIYGNYPNPYQQQQYVGAPPPQTMFATPAQSQPPPPYQDYQYPATAQTPYYPPT